MSPDLLDALAAVAVACHSDLLRAHPGLRDLHYDASVTDEEHWALQLLTSIDLLLEDIHGVRDPSVDPDPDPLLFERLDRLADWPGDDDIEF